MAGHTYVTNGYSNYPDVPTQEGGYVYGPNQQANWYVVETTTVERFRVPPNGYNNFDGGYNNFDNGYNNFGGAPLRKDYRKDYMPNYAPQGHYEIYEANYGSDNANASPPRYHERENLMDNFLNKLQIGNKYRPTSPNKYRPKSPTYGYPSRKPQFIQTQYLPAPNRYRPISPTKYRPTSPTKYRPTSPTKYRPSSPAKYRPTSPTKYRPISPNKYRPTSPTKYRPTRPTNNQTTSRENYGPTSPVKYRSTSPAKYRPISPTKYQPTNMAKFQHANPSKNQPTSPTANHPSKENQMFMAQNLPDPNTTQHTNPAHSVPSREIQPIRTGDISDPNKFLPSSPGREDGRNVKADNFSGPNNHWQTANPPAPHKPLTTPTNDINEALSSLAESANNSPRAQPIKSENRFGWNSLGATTRRFMRSDTIDSKEAMKKYNGAHVP